MAAKGGIAVAVPRSVNTCVVVLCLLLAVLPGAFGAGTEWTPAKVEEATRLKDIVFFKESLPRGHPQRPNRHFAWGGAIRGSVVGLESLSTNLPSAEAAQAGEMGLRLNITTSGDDPAWQMIVRAELMPPVGVVSRSRPFFDVHAYRPQGALEFDLRGEAKGKGLGVAFFAAYGTSARLRLTPLDPYLADTTDWQHVVVPVADMDFDTPNANLHIASDVMIGGEGWVGPLSMDLDNIVLRSDGPEPERGPVRVNHVGYLPESHKIGLVCGSRLFRLAGRPFVVREVDAQGEPHGEGIFRGELKLRTEFEPELYGEWVYEADFTPVRQTGRYVLEVPGVGSSVNFYVHDAIYEYLFYHLGRFFFYQRNGCALPEKNAFEWVRGEIYTQPTPFLSDESKTKLVRHGWFDAGDSRLFPRTRQVGMMFLAWELSRDKHFDGQLNIPESGNGVPDFLDELRWHVEYFREMQLADGSCPGYLTTGKGGGNPIDGRNMGYENDPDPRYIRDDRFSYDESVRICACLAMMARCLKPYDAEGAAVYGAAAVKAWDWARRNQPAQEEGETPGWQDDMLWAAVELWRLTGEERFHAVVRELADTEPDWSGFSWRYQAYLGWVSYVLDARGNAGLRERFRTRYVEKMDTVLETCAESPYGVVFYPHRWFLNPANVGHTGALLCIAWKLTGEEKYRDLAEEHLHYVCGRNIYRLCAISNVAQETYSWPLHMLEWIPGRETWMPGCVMHMSISHSGNLSRFVARRIRMTRVNWYFSDLCVGFNSGPVAAAMMLMEGTRYDDLIQQGAFPGVKPFRPGLPCAPTEVGVWGTEPVIPGAAD